MGTWLSRSTFQQLRDHAITTVKPSAICWWLNLHRRLHVVWYCQGLTTAMLCSMAFHLATSRRYSIFTTVQHKLFSRRQGDLAQSHYYASCTGCRFNIESHASRWYWRTRFGPLQHQCNWVTTSSYVTACGFYTGPWPLECLNHSPVQHMPSMHSAVLLRPPGTLRQEQNSYWQRLTRDI